jgi:PPK2 family polyphosphate:nucleotide phosphotransferase
MSRSSTVTPWAPHTLDDPRLAGLAHACAPHRFDLAAVDPGARPFSDPPGPADARTDRKAAERARIEALAAELGSLQETFFADGRFGLLVVLQGLDTSGKDGTIRGVFGRMDALGVQATSWRAPSEAERAHDTLWRIHARIPARGEIALFNRSHYEDVLVPVVNGSIGPDAHAQRLRQIADFERMLAEQDIVVLKFLLHISRDEQRERLQARVDDPAKRWKFDPADLVARRQWDAYQQAYADAVSATGTPWAPWIVVPADSKTHRNRMVAEVVVARMRALGLAVPPGDPGIAGLRID